MIEEGLSLFWGLSLLGVCVLPLISIWKPQRSWSKNSGPLSRETASLLLHQLITHITPRNLEDGLQFTNICISKEKSIAEVLRSSE